MNAGSTTPTVSIGVPVYNMAGFVGRALDSILAQDFEDWEVILVDNASTDGTASICAEYSSRDSRIRFYRNETNLGAAPNFNKSFELASGKYFKWLAADDWVENSYLRKCVEILETHPEVSVCHTQTSVYSEDGKLVQKYIDRLDGMNESPRKRFLSAIRHMNMVYQVFGVMRRELLDRTMLMGTIQGADHTVVAEMALQGKIYMVPEYLNANRTTLSVRAIRDHRSWWDEKERKHKRPTYTLLGIHHLKAIYRSRLSRAQKFVLSSQTTLHFLTKYRFVVFREMKKQLVARITLRRVTS